MLNKIANCVFIFGKHVSEISRSSKAKVLYKKSTKSENKYLAIEIFKEN